MTKMDDTKTLDISESIPKLDDSEKKIATSDESAKWAIDTLKFYSNGYVLPRNRGVTLQVIDEKTVRCISVVSDERCLLALSMMKLTFESVGIEFQIDPFAVILSVTPQPEDAPPYLMEERNKALESTSSEEANEHISNMEGYNAGIEVV